MNIERRLRQLFKIIVEETKSNSAFAERLGEALSDVKESKTPKRRHRRTPAVLDPIQLISEGKEILRQKLSQLNIEQLKDIVAEFGMDSSKLVMKWRKSDRIIDHIVSTAQSRSRKGDAFRGS